MSDFFTTRAADDFQQIGWLKPYLKGIRGFIAGGAFKNAFDGKPVKDLDVFFRSQEDWAHAVKKFSKRGWASAYENDRVQAFIHPKSGIRVELIGNDAEVESTNAEFGNDPFVVYNSPEETIAGFDFTVTKFALYRDGDEWKAVHHVSFFEHLHLRRLVIDDFMVKPLSTFERSYRYAGYGFRLCRTSKIKLVTAIQDEQPFEDEAQLSASFYDGVD